MNNRIPLLQFRFNSITNNQIIDQSDSGLNGTIHGGCTVVNDPVMGRCMKFNGSTGYIQLGDCSFDFSNGLTIAAWVYFEKFNNYSSIIDFGNGQSKENIVFQNTLTDATLQYNSVINGNNNNAETKSVLLKKKWLYVAVTVDKSGNLVMFISKNGELEQQAKDQNKCYLPAKAAQRTSNYIGKSNWTSGVTVGLFQGRMAWLTMYDQPLTSAQLEANMQEGKTNRQSATGSSRQSFPVDFSLNIDNDGARIPVLFIESDSAGEDLYLSVKNTSDSALTLQTPASTDVSETNYHFQLRFRPGTLLETKFNNIGKKDLVVFPGSDQGKWKVQMEMNTKSAIHYHYISFLCTEAGVRIAASDEYKIVIKKVNANSKGGARGTNVEFRYDQVSLNGPASIIRGTRMQHMSIVNHRGQKNIPLHVDVVGSPTVLNDGSTANSLIMRVVNPSSKSISLPSGSIQSKFVLRIPSQPNTALLEQDNAAKIQIHCGLVSIAKACQHSMTIPLAEPLSLSIPNGAKIFICPPTGASVSATVNGNADQAAKSIEVASKLTVVENSEIYIDATDPNSQWTVAAPESASTYTEWIITNKQRFSLTPDRSLQIRLTNIVTGRETGQSTIYLGYNNIPGYWDGQFTIPVHKGPMVFREKKVGIGTSSPKSELEISGSAKISDGLNVGFTSEDTPVANRIALGDEKFCLDQTVDNYPLLKFDEDDGITPPQSTYFTYCRGPAQKYFQWVYTGTELMKLDINGLHVVKSDVYLTSKAALKVDGDTTLNKTLSVTGNTTLKGALKVDKDTTLKGALTVDGDTTLNKTLTVVGKLCIGTKSTQAKLTVSGTENLSNGLNAAIQITNSGKSGSTWYLRSGAKGTNTPESGFSIADTNAYRLLIDSSGKVSIGKDKPGALDVNGSIKCSKNFIDSNTQVDAGGWEMAATISKNNGIISTSGGETYNGIEGFSVTHIGHGDYGYYEIDLGGGHEGTLYVDMYIRCGGNEAGFWNIVSTRKKINTKKPLFGSDACQVWETYQGTSWAKLFPDDVIRKKISTYFNGRYIYIVAVDVHAKGNAISLRNVVARPFGSM